MNPTICQACGSSIEPPDGRLWCNKCDEAQAAVTRLGHRKHHRIYRPDELAHLVWSLPKREKRERNYGEWLLNGLFFCSIAIFVLWILRQTGIL